MLRSTYWSTHTCQPVSIVSVRCVVAQQFGPDSPIKRALTFIYQIYHAITYVRPAHESTELVPVAVWSPQTWFHAPLRGVWVISLCKDEPFLTVCGRKTSLLLASDGWSILLGISKRQTWFNTPSYHRPCVCYLSLARLSLPSRPPFPDLINYRGSSIHFCSVAEESPAIWGNPFLFFSSA